MKHDTDSLQYETYKNKYYSVHERYTVRLYQFSSCYNLLLAILWGYRVRCDILLFYLSYYFPVEISLSYKTEH